MFKFTELQPILVIDICVKMIYSKKIITQYASDNNL